MIHIYEGEASMRAQCNLLGQFEPSGIPPAPCCVRQIEFTFDIDANGILNVSDEDKATNKKNTITHKLQWAVRVRRRFGRWLGKLKGQDD